MSTHHEPSLSDYDWLVNAIRPHCDKVLQCVADYGNAIGIGCQWGSGPTQRRIAIVAERAGYDHVPSYSLNAAIEHGKTTREQVIANLLKSPT